MAKYSKNDRVVVKHKDGSLRRAKVTGRKPGGRVTVVTDSGSRMTAQVRKLKKSPDEALILETRLDRSLRSDRTYGPMLQQWFSAFDVVALWEKVHTVEDMRRFLQREGRNVRTRFIHINGHGTDEEGKGTAKIHLTFESLDLSKPDHLKVFEGLRGKVIVFSCCQIGADTLVLERIKETSKAAAVIAYRKNVDDWYTNVVEALLYERLIKSRMKPQMIVEKVAAALTNLGIKPSDVVARKPVLVCV